MLYMKVTVVMVTVHEGGGDVVMVTVHETGDDGGRGGHGCCTVMKETVMWAWIMSVRVRLCLPLYDVCMCASGAVNTLCFVWKFSCITFPSLIHAYNYT